MDGRWKNLRENADRAGAMTKGPSVPPAGEVRWSVCCAPLPQCPPPLPPPRVVLIIKRIRSLAVRCATYRRPRTIVVAAAVVVVAVDETPRRDADYISPLFIQK